MYHFTFDLPYLLFRLDIVVLWGPDTPSWLSAVGQPRVFDNRIIIVVPVSRILQPALISPAAIFVAIYLFSDLAIPI